MMDDERFYKLVNKETMDAKVQELAKEAQTRCGMILLQSLTMNHEEMTKLNEGSAQDMFDFCHRFELAVANRIIEIGNENGIEARKALEQSRREGKYD